MSAHRIMKQKIALCLDAPFFGVLLMSLKVVETTSVPTMATDGVSLFWNPAYVDPLSDTKLKGLLAHEVMHNASLHHTRRGHRDPRKWNVACDACIDHLLDKAGYSVPDTFANMPEWDWARGMTAEAIYAAMPTPPQPPPQPQPQPQPGNGQPGDGQPQPGDGQPQPGDGPPSKAPRPGGVLDNTKKGAEADTKIAVQQAATVQAMFDRRKGTGSAWLKNFIDEVMQPKVRWQDLLAKFFEPLVPCDYSWARPNRRHVHSGLYLPGVVKDGIGEGVVYFDTSGSCAQDWPQFVGELVHIFNETSPERIHVVMCDTSVKEIKTYEQGEPFDPKVIGGGGSDFRPAFKAVAALDADIKWAIVLSDMEIDFPTDAPPYPVIAVSTTSTHGPVWATNIRIN